MGFLNIDLEVLNSLEKRNRKKCNHPEYSKHLISSAYKNIEIYNLFA